MMKKLLLLLLFGAIVSALSAQEMPANPMQPEGNPPEELISFYPNPSKDFVKVTNVERQEVEVSIFNVLGNQVYNRKVSAFETHIDLTNFPKGVYIIAFNDSKRTITERLVKE